MTIGDLAEYARQHPAQLYLDVHGAAGRDAGYPPCCIEWYAALIPFVSMVGTWLEHGLDDHPEVEAYWGLALPHPTQCGYVRCPACLGLPLSTVLDTARIIAARRRWRRAIERDRRTRWFGGRSESCQTE